jgi:4-hydroxymandelate oxidase
VTVLGKEWAAPFMVAPMAFAKLAHPDGEIAVAQAAAARGVGICLSTQATICMEDVYPHNPAAPMWFQLYVYKDRAVTLDLVQRAEACGYQALVLTVDTPYLGKRERDLRNRFRLPPELRAANFNRGDMPRMPEAGSLTSLVARYDTALTWDDLAWFRSVTRLPLLLKGILRGDDAALAVQHGVDGILVSNHGGRQLDTAIPSIEALPEIAEAVDGRVDILLDGGVRRGTDVLKALALGAKAVLIGRPIYYALAAGGMDGVMQAFDVLRDEYDLALALSGCRSAADITRDLVKLP